MERLAPYLPFVVTRVGVEAHFYATITHLLDDVAGVFNTGILLATADEKYIQILVERLHVGEHSWHLLL